ncbi:MAG: hypothetical protein K8F25_06215 [Fimbriimonadaceae bacterium]|nr:hypothetical protein [Alphaproteobacteria bacterium]
MSDVTGISPLADRRKITTRQASALAIEEITDRGMVDLRLDPDDFDARGAAERVLGFVLPTNPRTSNQSRGRTALWWSPDQWIITCARRQAGNLAKKLEQALEGHHAMATDVSDTRTIIKVTGNGARTTIMKGTSADLLLPDVEPGHVRRTQIAETALALHVVSTKPESVEIYVFRSYADYIWTWLSVAARKGAEIRLFDHQTPPRV